jgi:hypothetical protein
MLRNGDVVQIHSNHGLYGGLMFVVQRAVGEDMIGTFPGMAGGTITLPVDVVARKLGRVEQIPETFYGIPLGSDLVSFTQRA